MVDVSVHCRVTELLVADIAVNPDGADGVVPAGKVIVLVAPDRAEVPPTLNASIL